jgi:DNA-binding CsgD family transcriptional regulator
MESLSVSDLKLLNWGILKIYSLRDITRFGVDALSIVHQLVPCDRPLYLQMNLQTKSIDVTMLAGNRQDLAKYTRLVNEVLPRYLHEHPIVQDLSIASEDLYQISDFLSQEELHQREGIDQQFSGQQFLHPLQLEEPMQFFLPIDKLGDWLSLDQGDRLPVHVIQAGFILNHSSHSFTDRDRLILNLLRPHLALAYCNAKQNHQSEQNQANLQQSINQIGMIILDGSGFIKQATDKATDWLDQYFVKSTDRDRLPDRLWSWVAYQVSHLTIDSDAVKPFLPLYIEQSDQKLVIRLIVEPDQNQYMILLEEQTKPSLKSLELLGLSQRETEVLQLIMQGKDNKTIATELGIGVSTIRKHLENIYRKFGVQSRTEAISYALKQLGVLS